MTGAGGSYEISPAHSAASAQAANQSAGTVINFGAAANVHGGQVDQTSRATATATASRGPASSNVAVEDTAAPGMSQPNWILIGTIAGAALLITTVIILKK